MEVVDEAAEFDLLKPEEVADILGVKPRTLQDWAQKRKGPPFVQVGTDRNRRYRRSDLKAYIDAQVVQTS